MLCSPDKIICKFMKPDVKYLNEEINCQHESDIMIISFSAKLV